MKHVFTYPYNKAKTIALILVNTKEPGIFSLDKVIYAKVSRNKKRIKLYHGILHHNPFMPIFELRLNEESGNKTVARGFWRWPLYTEIFTAVILSVVLCFIVEGVLSQNYKEIFSMMIVPLFYTCFSGLCVWLERKNMKKIIDHLKNMKIFK